MTMKKKYLLAAMVAMALPAAAQETYQDTKLVQNELNGTARYVGMGGAMEALGADLSTISTNPAGIGLFRSSQVAISGGLVAQQDATTTPSLSNNFGIHINGDKTNASFDQGGFVYSMRTGYKNYLNFAFNYHKSRNFDQILTAGNKLNNASQNKLTAMKYPYLTDYNINAVDACYSAILNPIKDASGKQTGLDYLNGTEFLYGQYQKGYIGSYDFNISGNINDRVFLGLTFGIHDVHYQSNSLYSENLEKETSADAYESLKITGTGYDLKAGVIFRPIEQSPFRIGLYVNTPVWYDLHEAAATDVSMFNSSNNKLDKGHAVDYDYKVYTPWKFGVSLGHTIDKMVAIGATYEYADYSRIDNRINDGGGYDDWGYYYDNSSSDDAMNSNTKRVLKGVSTLKLGAEVKVMPQLAVRAGYNYVSPMFNQGGYRDGSIESPGSFYATSTDYTNWKSTNRWTCGVGYTAGKFFADLAYQYTQTNGDFYPFMSYYDTANSSNNGIVDATKVNFKRNQVLLTLGYKF